jgi:hypothetical protein
MDDISSAPRCGFHEPLSANGILPERYVSLLFLAAVTKSNN